MQPRPIYNLYTAPGHETFGDDLMDTAGSETIGWSSLDYPDQHPKTIRAIVRGSSQKIESLVQTILKIGVMAILVSSKDVQGISDGDIIVARSRTFRVADGGVWPDGFALTKIELTEVAE